jgi:hypothetical protein
MSVRASRSCDGCIRRSSASRFDVRFGREAALHRRPGRLPRSFEDARSAWKISRPAEGFRRCGADGMTMISWMSTLLRLASAVQDVHHRSGSEGCAAVQRRKVPNDRYSGIFAAARWRAAAQIPTRRALTRWRRVRSWSALRQARSCVIPAALIQSLCTSAFFAMVRLTFPTAFPAPFPPYRLEVAETGVTVRSGSRFGDLPGVHRVRAASIYGSVLCADVRGSQPSARIEQVHP